jgi:hypothetical protein
MGHVSFSYQLAPSAHLTMGHMSFSYHLAPSAHLAKGYESFCFDLASGLQITCINKISVKRYDLIL